MKTKTKILYFALKCLGLHLVISTFYFVATPIGVRAYIMLSFLMFAIMIVSIYEIIRYTLKKTIKEAIIEAANEQANEQAKEEAKE